jgi:glycine oxidase
VNAIVIGAGVVGCAVAYELAARGVGVRVLDMRGAGQGATRASAGVLCPHIEGHAAALLQLGVRSLALYDAFVERVAGDAHRPIEYRRTGTLEVALAEDEAERLQVAARSHTRAGVEHRLLGPREALELEPALSREVAAALFIPVHGYIGVAAFTDVLSAAARLHGAVLEAGMAARRVTRRRSVVAVETQSATFEADAVVIAAGSWSGQIAIEHAPVPVKPVRGQLLHLAAAPAEIERVIWGPECYVVPWQDGTLLVGATVEDVGFDERATAAGVRDLLQDACELLPALYRAEFRGVRVGLRPATADELPIIGRSSTLPGVYYATGHYRNGVLLAPLTAAAVADLILTGREAPELAATRPARFGL